MAQLKLTLPALKLTKHHRSGSQSVSYLPRILPSQGQELPSVPSQKEDHESSNAMDDLDTIQPDSGLQAMN